MVAQVGYSVAGRSRGRMTSCAVCTVHVETRSADFLVELQNQGRLFVSGLTSKPLWQFLIGLCLKTDGDGLWMVCPQNHWDGFSSVCASKLVVTVCLDLASKTGVGFLVEPQNQGGGGFPGLGLKTGSFCLVIWTSKSPRRFLSLGLKIKRALVCRLRHKTDRWRWKQVWLEFFSLTWRLTEVRRQVVHVVPLQSLRRRQVKDGWVDATGYIEPCYPTFTVFNVLGTRSIVVI
jgi:hypothetical protein